jgi:large subunit ribosomal protein L9
MEVILTKDVEGIGKAGAVVKVKDGFARNFLLLQNKAVLVTAGNMKNLQEDKARRQLKEEKAKKAAEELKAKIATLSLTIAVLTQEEKEKLYANITAVELQKALSDEGIEIDKKAILLEEPIKALGIYQVPLKLHPEVTGEVKVWIVKK